MSKIVKNGGKKEKKMERMTLAELLGSLEPVSPPVSTVVGVESVSSGITVGTEAAPAAPGAPGPEAVGDSRNAAEGSVASAPTGRMGEYSVEFAKGKRLTCGRFNGKTYVHIREYIATDRKVYPTKIGVALTPVRVKVLRGHFDGIDEALRQLDVNSSCGVEVGGTGQLYQVHLGGGFYATVNEKINGVDLRRYFVPEGQQKEIPTRKGIFVPSRQWTFLKKKVDELISLNQEIQMTEVHFHQGQLEMMECSECSPYGWTF
jgi:hypothetical protein